MPLFSLAICSGPPYHALVLHCGMLLDVSGLIHRKIGCVYRRGALCGPRTRI